MKDVSEILAFLTDKRFKKDSVRLDGYKVPGFAENFFKSTVIPKMRKYAEERVDEIEKVPNVA